MNKEKLDGMLWGSFCADAYALGAHWVYDIKEIENANLNLNAFNNPLTTYHGSKRAGDFTHYGDQTLWLLESISNEKKFDALEYSKLWLENIKEYNGYIDGASKATIEGLDKGLSIDVCGSSSRDLSAAGRIAPLIYFYNNDKETLLETIKLQTNFTHRNESVEESALFFAELTLAMVEGVDLNSAITSLSKNYSTTLQKWVEQANQSILLPTSTAIANFGQSCSVNVGFLGVIHLLIKYQNDYMEALKENVLSGGDSAARGMIVGMVLGAKLENQIEQSFKSSLTNFDKINSFF